MEQVLIEFATKWPWLTTVLLVVGTMRLVFKPLCVAVQSYVESTESTKDNETWDKIKAHWLFKGFAFVLDYLGSIKVGGPVAPAKVEPPKP